MPWGPGLGIPISHRLVVFLLFTCFGKNEGSIKFLQSAPAMGVFIFVGRYRVSVCRSVIPKKHQILTERSCHGRFHFCWKVPCLSVSLSDTQSHRNSSYSCFSQPSALSTLSTPQKIETNYNTRVWNQSPSQRLEKTPQSFRPPASAAPLSPSHKRAS